MMQFRYNDIHVFVYGSKKMMVREQIWRFLSPTPFQLHTVSQTSTNSIRMGERDETNPVVLPLQQRTPLLAAVEALLMGSTMTIAKGGG
jgi:hypothetical protein